MNIQESFADAYVGIVIGRRERGIRLNPYIEIRGEPYDLKRIQLDLLSLSVGCTIRKGFLRIQGIQNCKLIAPYTKHDWFRKAMVLFGKGEHLKEEGKEKILNMVPRDEKSRTKSNRIEISSL